MRAFVSYAREDRSLIDDLIIPTLQDGYGIQVRTDKDIPKTAIWTDWVLKEIQDNDYVILLITKSYQESLDAQQGACHAEYQWIVQHFIERGTKEAKILAIIREGEVPKHLATINHIDVRNVVDVRRELKDQFASLAPQGSIAMSNEHGRHHPIVNQRLTEHVNVKGPQDLPDVVKLNFERNADRYAATLDAQNSMQRRNAVELFRMIKTAVDREDIPSSHDSWLDIGCGTGLVGKVAQYAVEEHRCDWIREAHTKLGFDNAPNMIASLTSAASETYSDVFEADLREMAPDALQNRVSAGGRVSLILANNVFHWLLDSTVIGRAFQACREVLLPGGTLAASIAAAGTGRDFLSAYRQVLRERIALKSGGDAVNLWQSFLENPIGLQTLPMIVGHARDNFKILEAKLTYEPVRYDDTDQYVEAAKGYGNDIYMAPLLSYTSSDDQEEVWDEIKAAFRKLHDEKFSRRTYIHDQYMVYILLRGL